MADLGWTIYGEPRAGRKCGSCSFCCVVVPIEQPLNKPANVRCQHLRAKGCGIYAGRSDVCKYWSCVWLFQGDTMALKRPDIGGYAVDPMLDEIRIDGQARQVIQLWIDPKRPEAHRAPELRAWLEMQFETRGLIALARPGNKAGDPAMLLVPPRLSDTGEWFESVSAILDRQEYIAKGLS